MADKNDFRLVGKGSKLFSKIEVISLYHIFALLELQRQGMILQS